VGGECAEVQGSVVTGYGRISKGCEDRENEWMRRGRKNSWEGELDSGFYLVQGMEESERGKNRDKKIVMVKLIQKKKNIQYHNNENVSLAKILGLFL
jgi:hypothetical protein